MTESRKEMKNHVSAAKEWLGKAEQSLEKENDIKGNLNLMLAQAELARACEKKKDKSLLIHSMLVAGIVGMAFFFGFGGVNVGKEKPVIKAAVLPAPLPSSTELKSSDMQRESPHIATVKELSDGFVEKDEDVPLKRTAVVKDAAAVKAVNEAVPRQEKLSVTPVQMQQLVSAAGKSLRGQD